MTEGKRHNVITNNYLKKLILAFIEHLTMSFRCITLYNSPNSLEKVEGVLIIPRTWIWKLRLNEVMPFTQGVTGKAVLESQLYLRPTQALHHLRLPLLPVNQLLPVNHCCQQTKLSCWNKLHHGLAMESVEPVFSICHNMFMENNPQTGQRINFQEKWIMSTLNTTRGSLTASEKPVVVSFHSLNTILWGFFSIFP